MRLQLPATLALAVVLAHCGLDFVGVEESAVAVPDAAAPTTTATQPEPDASVVSPVTDAGVDPAAAPLLRFLPNGMATFTPESAPVNLTTDGTDDWSMWGFSSSTAQQHKLLATSLISDLDRSVTITSPGTGYPWPVAVTWTDGDIDASSETTTEFVFSPQKLSFTVAASAKPRKLTIHLAAYYAHTVLTATMNGATTITAALDNPGNYQGQVIALELASPTDATVAIDFVMANAIPDGGLGVVDIIAATLADE